MILVAVGYLALIAKFGLPGLFAVLLHVAILFAPITLKKKAPR